jgi:hypothetical protein
MTAGTFLQRAPEALLTAICQFVDLSAPADFLSAAARLVRPSRHATSALLVWPNETARMVERRVEEASGQAAALRPLLAHYISPGPRTGVVAASRIKPTRTRGCQLDFAHFAASAAARAQSA